MTQPNSQDAGEDKPSFTIYGPDELWWVSWRISGDLCGRTLVPLKTADAADIAEKAVAIYGKGNVWLERDTAVAAAAPGEGKVT